MLLSCPSCQQKNRVRADRLAEARCGACQSSLAAPAVPIEADTRAFDEIIGASPLPVLVDFWAPWCGPCRRAAPEVEAAARRLAGKALVLKVDTEANPDVAARLGIRGIPYFAVFRGGRAVAEQTGLVGADRLVALVGG